MAITRTQIAKQLLANGGRTGFFEAGLAAGDEISPGTAASSSERGPTGRGGPPGTDTSKVNIVPQKNVFQKLADLSLAKKGLDIFAGFLKGPKATTKNIVATKGGGLDLPLWAKLGFSSQEDYEAALRDQMLMADGGRIGFQRGGRRGDTGQASQSVGGPSDSSGDGVGGQGGKRGDFGQASINLSRNFDIGGGRGGNGEITNSNLIEKFPTGIRTIDRINLDRMIANMNLDNMITDDDDENEKSLQETLAGAITNQPEFQSKIDATVSGIMANPDLAGLGTITQGKADGGPIGGIMDLETGRQQYFLGKLVKKVGRTVKKIAKSPLGRAALLYTGAAGLGALGAGTGFAGFKSSLLSPSTILSNLAAGGRKLGILETQFPAFSKRVGPLSGLGVEAAIFGASTLAGALTPKQEQQAQDLAKEEGIDIEAARRSILERAEGNIAGDLRMLSARAEGGRIGYQEGSKEPVAKKTMPLLDMGGKEMDLREEGGFVPIGRMEKADDVPARLSKNEFVFTADAVRNAGEGDVDKGAEVMYNMMKNLEAGGEVSEESQGLEGARKMFQTSQRLEEVL